MSGKRCLTSSALYIADITVVGVVFGLVYQFSAVMDCL